MLRVRCELNGELLQLGGGHGPFVQHRLATLGTDLVGHVWRVSDCLELAHDQHKGAVGHAEVGGPAPTGDQRQSGDHYDQEACGPTIRSHERAYRGTPSGRKACHRGRTSATLTAVGRRVRQA